MHFNGPQTKFKNIDNFGGPCTLHTKIVKHRLHVCVQNASVFWCSGVSQEMKIKDVHEMYSWIQMRREWMCRSNAQLTTLPAVIQNKTYRTSHARFRWIHLSIQQKILLPMFINTKFLFCNYQRSC